MEAVADRDSAPEARATERSRSLRLAVAGGGTGGHIVPGLHLLDHLDAAGVDLESLLWFTSGRPVESHAMARLESRTAGRPFERVVLPLEPAGGGAPGLPRLALRLGPAMLRARSALRRQRSSVLLGLGGFTAAPAVLAARSLGIPVALLEVNSVLGRATRALAPFAHMVLHAWPGERLGPEPDKHPVVGPPLAPSFCPPPEADRPRLQAELKAGFGFSPDRPLVVVFGGSQGAKGLNDFIRKHQTAMCAAGVQILHQVGPGRAPEGAVPLVGYRVLEYVNDVYAALIAADLVLCRGGASTLAELAAVETPAWVVPYPYHADHHQERNARLFEPGVRIVNERELGVRTREELVRLVSDDGREEREAMRSALRGRVPLDAGARILETLLALKR